MKVNFDIDYVFPWVNDMDSVWRNTYQSYCETHGEAKRLEEMKKERYRDWGLLKFLFRAIEKNMPWIRNLYLIVSNKEQVPAWVNQENVKIVLHEDIIPARFLPTFNSTAIEMFIWKIPELAEHFIYGNDDIYPMRPSEPDDWFTPEGNPRCNMRVVDVKMIMCKQFRMVCAKQWWALQNATNNIVNRTNYRRPWHGLAPLDKTKCAETIQILGEENVFKTISAFRTDNNYNQYIYLDYMFLKDYLKPSGISFDYVGAKKPLKLLEAIEKSNSQVICINDCNNDLTKLQLATLQVLCAKAFEKKLPDKCKYEN